MRIGLDARTIRDHFPGISRYVYNLACALPAALDGDSLVILMNAHQPTNRYDLAALRDLPCVEVVTLATPPLSLREQVALPLAARRLRLDVLHAPYYVRAYAMPVPVVTTLYDVTPTRYPEYLPSRRARAAYEATTRLAVETSAALLTLSEAARDDLAALYGARPNRITVTPPAPGPTYTPRPAEEVACLRERLALPEAYVLYVGINKPHKNLPRLVEAFAQVAREAPDAALVLAGRPDPRYPEAETRIRELGLTERVRLLGDVAEADLPALYSGAAVFAFPSLYEGFGFPVLEAMACGAPVVASNASSLPEVVGSAGCLVPPDDSHALARAIVAVLQDGRLWTRLHQAGQARAATFTWARTAAQTVAVLRDVARR